MLKKRRGGLIRGSQVQKRASGRGLLKTTFTEGGIGIFGLLFWLFFKSVFVPKNYGFLVWCSLRSVDFPFFSIWFSVKCGFRISSFGSGFFSICSIVVRLH